MRATQHTVLLALVRMNDIPIRYSYLIYLTTISIWCGYSRGIAAEYVHHHDSSMGGGGGPIIRVAENS